MLKFRRQVIRGTPDEVKNISRDWQPHWGKTMIIREDSMRTFWENESVPYALERSPRRLYRLLQNAEERIEGGKVAEILSKVRPISEAEAKSLAAMMSVRK